MRVLTWGAAVMVSGAALSACGANVAFEGAGGDTGTTTGTITGTTTFTTSTTGTTTTVTTSTTTPTTTMTSGCGSFEYTDLPACNACMENNCCDALAQCDVGTPCGAFFACAEACGGDSACGDGCVASASGLALMNAQALASCYGATCAQAPECFLGVCDSGFEAPSPACGACLGAQCCNQFAACVADAFPISGGEACLDCLVGTPTDIVACAANPLYAAALDCELAKCPGECGSNGAGICDTGLTTSIESCDTCLGIACCAPLTACMADTSSPSCFEGCLISSPLAPECFDESTTIGAIYQAISGCWKANCSDLNVCGSSPP